jgi:hypothetical protein
MIAIDTGARTASDVARVVRALGAHRYVAGRLHLVHEFAFASLEGGAFDELDEGARWAASVLAQRDVDIASRDERLWRRASDAEVAAVLSGFWSLGTEPARARDRLRAWLARAELPVGDGDPFDPDAEEDTHPLLVDAGWEIAALGALDPSRHRGAIESFGDALAWESARFEEAEAVPPIVQLHELPAVGPVELLRGADDAGELVEPLTLWVEGNATYHDYLVRGVRRAAKLG